MTVYQSSAFPNPQVPLQTVIPSYLYQEYSDDENLQAFVASYNTLAQSYLNWFNSTSLAVYTSSSITGLLLDWIGNGIYGIPRPVLSTQQILTRAGYNEYAYDTTAYNSLKYSSTGTSTPATDDIYKRVMTWNLYRGDGKQFCIQWLKNRVARFLNGPNGSDVRVLDYQPSIILSGSTFTISASASSSFMTLQQCLANGSLIVPFQYQFIVANYLFNDGGVLGVLPAAGYPTSSVSLPAGSIWSNGGMVTVVPGITPNPSAPPIYFATVSAATLLSTGGGNLPLSNPGPGTGQLWNNGGVVSIA